MKLRRWAAGALLLLLLVGCASPKEKETAELSLPGLTEPETPELSGEPTAQTDPTGPVGTMTSESDTISGEETEASASEPAGTTESSDPEADTVSPPETEAPSSEPGPISPPETEAPSSEPGPISPPETETPSSEPGPISPPETEAPSSEPEPTSPPEPDRPAVLSMGLYAGPFPEDGTDEDVDSVAVILVENRSDVQLQYAELHYRIDDREAVFRVSELPPGAVVMTMEIHRLIALPTSVWISEPESDLAVYLASEPEDRLAVRSDSDGTVTVTNQGTEQATFDLFYKQKNDEGIFVGGIAYHVRIPDLGPGETRTLDAGHYTAKSEIVRITVNEP